MFCFNGKINICSKFLFVFCGLSFNSFFFVGIIMFIVFVFSIVEVGLVDLYIDGGL